MILGGIGKEYGSEAGNGGKPIKGMRMGGLLLYPLELSSTGDLLRGCVELSVEVPHRGAGGRRFYPPTPNSFGVSVVPRALTLQHSGLPCTWLRRLQH